MLYNLQRKSADVRHAAVRGQCMSGDVAGRIVAHTEAVFTISPHPFASMAGISYFMRQHDSFSVLKSYIDFTILFFVFYCGYAADMILF